MTDSTTGDLEPNKRTSTMTDNLDLERRVTRANAWAVTAKFASLSLADKRAISAIMDKMPDAAEERCHDTR